MIKRTRRRKVIKLVLQLTDHSFRLTTLYVDKEKEKDKDKKKDKEKDKLKAMPSPSPRPGGASENEIMPDEETLNALYAALLVSKFFLSFCMLVFSFANLVFSGLS